MVHFSRISFDTCFGRLEFGEGLIAYGVFQLRRIVIAYSSLLVSCFFFFFCKMEFVERFVCIDCFCDFDPIMMHRDGYLT